jgi:ABC-type uncharacterized transport system permease subunit
LAVKALRPERSAHGKEQNSHNRHRLSGRAVLLALVFTTIVLIVAKAPPLKAYSEIIDGSLGRW